MIDKHKMPSQAMLRAFDAYGRTNGIRSAANLLEVDHAVVSRHLNTLEAFVGTELIDRHSRKLTSDGEEYHRRISAALEEIGNATIVLRKRHSEQLLIWCSPGIAFHWLNPRLSELESLKNVLEVELRPSDRAPNLRSNEADGDIRYLARDNDQQYDARLKLVQIASPAVFPVASPGYAAGVKARLRVTADLLDLDLLHEESDLEWRLWFEQQGIGSLPAALPGAKLWHAHLTLDAARSGRGIVLSNRFLAENLLNSGELVRLEPADAQFRPAKIGGYYFIARNDRWSGRSLARFRNWLTSTANGFDTN